MSATLRERLERAVGAANVVGAATARPGASAEIAEIVRAAAESGARVTFEVDEKSPGGVTLDLGRMVNVLHLDQSSLLVTVQAGITAARLEEIVSARGMTIGPLPPASIDRTIGALLGAPRPSEASPAHGTFVGRAAAVAGVLPDGIEVQTRLAPRKATGPDLAHALLGGRGALGVITSATLRLRRRGEVREEAAFRFDAPRAALSVARALIVKGARPRDLTVLAEPPTLLMSFEGPAAVVEAERTLARALALGAGGAPTPHRAPAPWSGRVFERALPLERILETRLTRTARVVGWHDRGAALVDPAAGPARAAAPDPLLEAWKRALDPRSTLPAPFDLSHA
jgi:FAD/FMN-containing dehydrogenase